MSGNAPSAATPVPQLSGLRVGFAGTPEFAATALAALLAAGATIPLVLTQPDRPAGRGMKLQASPVKQLALQHHIPVAQPHSLRLDGKYPDEARAAQQTLQAAACDVWVVAAYGLILPNWVLQTPRLGCLNIHASLLPRWRGAAPIHRAIEAGDAETGITIMQMDEGLDTGDMLLIGKEAIRPNDTTGSLHDRLAQLGGDLIVQALAQLATGQLPATPQPADGITYAHKIDKAEAQIDWRQSAAEIARRVRAVNPFPGAATTLAGEPLKVWGCEVLDEADCSSFDSLLSNTDWGIGTVLSTDRGEVCVRTGRGVLRLTELQRAGSKRLAAVDFLRGTPVAVGTVLGGGGAT